MASAPRPNPTPADAAADAAARNLLHACAIWAERRGRDPATAVVIVDVMPPPVRVGLWIPGQANVAKPATMDDAAAEVAESLAPWLEHAFRFKPMVLASSIATVKHGGLLRALVTPSMGGIALQLLGAARDRAQLVLEMMVEPVLDDG